MFDDPPMAAYHVENNFKIIKQNPFAFPEMMTELDREAFYGFYEELAQKIYHINV